jgi:hypothetical protein
MYEEAIFITIIILFSLHEIDAVRTKEWKMLPVLKNMADGTALKVFVLVHIPLYAVILYILALGSTSAVEIMYHAVAILLIFHTIIHFVMREHPKNGFTSALSNIVIYSIGILAVVHLCMLILG